MLFERFEVPGLAHYSYAVGCPGAGRIAIVDPRRDVDVYQRFARDHDVEITAILETHIHADYASGARELAALTGAELYVSGYDKDETYEVAFAHRDMLEGDVVELGAVRLEALHTPGHTPEHLSFLVYDGARSKEVPMLMLSGDFLFVGSLGRPDLLGEEAKRQLAHQLFDSARHKIAALPDGLEVHPAHGAGSMCGSGMSGRPYSTLGYERLANAYLDEGLSEAAFVEKILSTVPPFPEYYKRMKQVNAAGPARLDELSQIEAVAAVDFKGQLEADRVVIDTRSAAAYGAGHIAGAFAIGAGKDLPVWASWVVPYERPLLLVVDDEVQVGAVRRQLVRVGLDRVEGFLKGGMAAWTAAGYEVGKTATISPSELQQRLQEDTRIRVLDVRSDEEWAAGHIAGAVHIMGGQLPDRIDELPAGGPIACICGSGYRSTVACSVLERAGIEAVINVAGGMAAWQKAKLSVQTSTETQTAQV